MVKNIKIFLCFSLIVIFASTALSAASFAAKKVKVILAKNEIVKIGNDIDVPFGITVDTATAIFGSINVSGEVKDAVVSIGGTVTLQPTAKVGKDVVAVGGKVIKEEGAKVGGNITEVGSPALFKGVAVPEAVGSAVIVGWSLLNFLMFVGLLALICLIVVLFPQNVGYVAAAAEKNPWKILGLGILGLILVPVIVVVLAISLIGIPLLPVYLIGVVIALLMGYVALLQIVGKAILKAVKIHSKPMLTEVFLGAVIIGLIGMVPILGLIVNLILCVIGLGGVLVTKFATKRVA